MTDIPHQFQDKVPSALSHHQQDCCENAWAWFRGMDGSIRPVNPETPPSWLRDRFAWGPSRWPVYWCDAATAESLDCGVFAAIARSLLSVRGVPVVPVQLVEAFTEENIENWRSQWDSCTANTDWLGTRVCYHEAIGILDGTDVVIWDPVDRQQINPSPPHGYGTAIAIQIYPPGDGTGPTTLDWNGHAIETGTWIDLQTSTTPNSEH